jgi:hypothetical protein
MVHSAAGHGLGKRLRSWLITAAPSPCPATSPAETPVGPGPSAVTVYQSPLTRIASIAGWYKASSGSARIAAISPHPVHDGHHHIGDQQIGPAAAGQLERLPAIGRRHHLKPNLQHPGQVRAHVSVVVGDQHQRPSCRPAGQLNRRGLRELRGSRSCNS